MKPFCLRGGFISLLIILAAFGASVSASAGDNTSLPLAASMRLMTTTIMQGEPVILHYSLSNLGGQKIGAHFGIYNNDWYTLSLVDQTGQPVGTVRDLRPARPASPIYRLPNPFLSPGQTRAGDIVVTRLFVVSHPGRYTLSVDVHLAMMEVPRSEEDPSHVEEMLETSSTTFTSAYRFSFVVTKADTASLQRIAETLRQTSVKNNGAQNGLLLSVDQLLSMPVEAALPSWQALVAGTDGKPALVVKSLSDFPSVRAADILASMAWDARWQPFKYPTDRVLMALQEMHETPDATLRQHIDGLFAAHGIKVADVPKAVD